MKFSSITILLLCLSVTPAIAAANSDHLPVPSNGAIKVAFMLEDGVTMIDFAGPWEVFQDVMIGGSGQPLHSMQAAMTDRKMPFELYTVAESKSMRRMTGGLQVTPDYTYNDAPLPNVVVIGAQSRNEAGIQWLQKISPKTDIIFSVCTGAFILGRAGLLDGKTATTHHWFQDQFEKTFPRVTLKRGVRFIDNGKIMTAAGLSSGIDGALHVVERYFGPEVAKATAEYMEYRRNE